MKPARDSKQINVLQELAAVLDIEIEALKSVRDNLTSEFETAVQIVASCRGQVVVTGIGKSGIIAKKIAATFRSTGTQAMFLHAGEALHGDIGMVDSRDVVLAVGKSGETNELNELLRYAKKTGAQIIAITANASSVMAKLSDVVLDLKVTREACPLNLAPTASTTAALAVGDALAVTLMKIKDISPEDFARNHPGGQLGRRLLLTVQDVMRKGEENPVIRIDRTVREMLIHITAFRVGAISVVNHEGELLGLVTDYDVRQALQSGRDLNSMTISEIMNQSPSVILDTDKAADALHTLTQRNKPTAVLPVLNNDRKVVGMVHLHDLIASGL